MAAGLTKLADLERDHILQTLRECGGNRTRAAKLLGISVRGLRLKLAGYLEAGYDVASPAMNQAEAAATGDPCYVRAKLGRPASAAQPQLNPHVRSQIGLSLRIFYDGILCAPLPDRLVAMTTRLNRDCP